MAEICENVAFMCRCREPVGHLPPHHCPCGSEWKGTLDGDDFEPVTYPPGVPQLNLPSDDPDW